ncbi:MAG: cell wall-active antibiotics response protein [Brevinematales bacterium]|nr:cell wall-active antibiotics response protein [Brevinematales bacterium]
MRWFSVEALSVFFGGLCILFGISLILKTFWNIDVPLFRIGISLFLIYVGLGLIFQPPWKWGAREKVFQKGSERSWIFSSAQVQLDAEASTFNAIFSSVEADFTSLKPEEKRVIQCNAVFGSLVVYVPQHVPVRFEGHAVFGNVEFPDKKSVSFGLLSSDNESGVVIVANAVFGSVEFKVK